MSIVEHRNILLIRKTSAATKSEAQALVNIDPMKVFLKRSWPKGSIPVVTVEDVPRGSEEDSEPHWKIIVSSLEEVVDPIVIPNVVNEERAKEVI
jgi:hypothetical protein